MRICRGLDLQEKAKWQKRCELPGSRGDCEVLSSRLGRSRSSPLRAVALEKGRVQAGCNTAKITGTSLRKVSCKANVCAPCSSREPYPDTL